MVTSQPPVPVASVPMGWEPVAAAVRSVELVGLEEAPKPQPISPSLSLGFFCELENIGSSQVCYRFTMSQHG